MLLPRRRQSHEDITIYSEIEYYIFYDADGQRATRVAGGQITVYFQSLWEDTLGVNARKLYTFDGAVIWGQVRSGGGSGTTLNYTGQRLDSTGLLFYNARYYDAGIGCFVSADLIAPALNRSHCPHTA